MPLFRRRRPIPEWAPFTDEGEWRAFAQVVEADVSPRGWRLVLEEGFAYDGENRYGLFNPAQTCRELPREEWAPAVHQHFETVVSADFERRFAGPEEARASLKARLLDDGYFRDVPVEGLWRRVADELRLVLAFDLPQAVTIPAAAEVLELGDEDELFALALAQTREEPGLELTRHDFARDDSGVELPLLALTGDSFFVSTYVLWADELDPPASEHGTLVAVPSRHTLLAHPIRDAGAIAALTHLLELAQRLCSGPGALTERLYWLRDGELERLDAWLDDEGAHFAPSDAFTAMMTGLD
jgi:hypothetical protein